MSFFYISYSRQPLTPLSVVRDSWDKMSRQPLQFSSIDHIPSRECISPSLSPAVSPKARKDETYVSLLIFYYSIHENRKNDIYAQNTQVFKHAVSNMHLENKTPSISLFFIAFIFLTCIILLFEFGLQYGHINLVSFQA